MHAPDQLLIEPEPRRWREALATRDTRPESLRFREQLGLPRDRPVVMSGHQPTVWHCGILAKWFATAAAAEVFGAAGAWIVVDHDAVAPLRVAFPYTDRAGRLRRGTLAMDRANERDNGVPRSACARPASRVHPRATALATEAGTLLPCVAAGLGRIAGSLDAHSGAPDAARQAALATADLLRDRAKPTLVFATELAHTDLFDAFRRRMLAEPRECARAYNDAAAGHTTLRPLAASASRVELPLWRLAPDGRRERVYSDVLRDTPSNALAPRALLLTLLTRSAGCDVFIHGTGGGDRARGYDSVMERWARTWLGSDVRLAPAATVSATRVLPFPAREQRTDAGALARASHRALHDPACLGDAPAAAAKRDLVSRIAGAARGSPERAGLYAELHGVLARYRAAHERELAELRARAADAASRASDDALRSDRAWAFALHPPETIATLQSSIEFTLRGARA